LSQRQIIELGLTVSVVLIVTGDRFRFASSGYRRSIDYGVPEDPPQRGKGAYPGGLGRGDRDDHLEYVSESPPEECGRLSSIELSWGEIILCAQRYRDRIGVIALVAKMG
jgi:hypothetical protein